MLANHFAEEPPFQERRGFIAVKMKQSIGIPIMGLTTIVVQYIPLGSTARSST